jgi:hypothetical protein
LRERPVDFPWPPCRELLSVESRVVDVDVEPVLVRRVAAAAEALVEDPAVRSAEVADPDPRRIRMRGEVLVEHHQQHADQAIAAPAAPGPVRHALQDGIPREVLRALLGELDAVHEPSRPRLAERARHAPLDRLRRIARTGRRRRGSQAEGSGGDEEQD